MKPEKHDKRIQFIQKHHQHMKAMHTYELLFDPMHEKEWKEIQNL